MTPSNCLDIGQELLTEHGFTDLETLPTLESSDSYGRTLTSYGVRGRHSDYVTSTGDEATLTLEVEHRSFVLSLQVIRGGRDAPDWDGPVIILPDPIRNQVRTWVEQTALPAWYESVHAQ